MVPFARALTSLHRTSRSSTLFRKLSRRCYSYGTTPFRTDHPNHNYTSGKWLYNDEAQHALRYSPFNEDGLCSTIRTALGCQSILRLTKIGEGTYNKVFRAECDDGRTAIARIPCPLILGNPSLITASEVATMTYVREICGLPVPKVFAWSKSQDNPVESPYIVMEDVQGVGLSSVWRTMRGPPIAQALETVVDNMVALMDHPFSSIGSLYFKEDFTSTGDRDKALFKEEFEHPKRGLAEERYCIGPIADPMWWRGIYADLKGDRGPWNDIGQYFIAAASLQEQALAKYEADPSLFKVTLSQPHDIPTIRKLLQQTIDAAPRLSQAVSNGVFGKMCSTNVMFHPDISISNVMVPPSAEDEDTSRAEERMAKQTYIDWQGTVIAPVVMQVTTPPLAAYTAGVIQKKDNLGKPDLPPGIDDMSEEDQEHYRYHHVLAMRDRYWCIYLLKRSTLAFAGQINPLYTQLLPLPMHLLRAVPDGYASLAECLIGISNNWHWLDMDPCPITFTESELEAYQREIDANATYQGHADQLRLILDCDPEGLVFDAYDAKIKYLEAVRQQWDPVEKGGPFPLEDGRWSAWLI